MPLFPVELLLVLRFLKLLGVLALAAGTIGAFLPRALEDRQRFAYLVAGPAFGVVWIAGWAMAFGGGVSLLAAWIVGAATASLLSINVVLWGVGREGRRSAGAATLACVLLAVSLAFMVWKPVL